jgi:hypothetical protein
MGLRPTQDEKTPSVQQPVSTEAAPFPLSSRPGFPAKQHWTRSRVRLSFKERRMRSVDATKFHRKSAGAQPRDLQFRGPFLETRNLTLPQNCHLDRSVAKWRDLRFLFRSHADTRVLIGPGWTIRVFFRSLFSRGVNATALHALTTRSPADAASAPAIYLSSPGSTSG